jgi:hypothetical protein
MNMKAILRANVPTFVLALAVAYVSFSHYKAIKDQARRMELQDRLLREWMSNTDATLEGVEYEMSRLMNVKQDSLYGK